jgi:hypothetical protein
MKYSCICAYGSTCVRVSTTCLWLAAFGVWGGLFILLQWAKTVGALDREKYTVVAPISDQNQLIRRRLSELR